MYMYILSVLLVNEIIPSQILQYVLLHWCGGGLFYITFDFTFFPSFSSGAILSPFRIALVSWSIHSFLSTSLVAWNLHTMDSVLVIQGTHTHTHKMADMYDRWLGIVMLILVLWLMSGRTLASLMSSTCIGLPLVKSYNVRKSEQREGITRSSEEEWQEGIHTVTTSTLCTHVFIFIVGKLGALECHISNDEESTRATGNGVKSPVLAFAYNHTLKLCVC